MFKTKLLFVFFLAGGVSLVSDSYALSPVNSVNDGQIISGGTYYNTANSNTTFINSASSGLWIKGGNTVRGLEVNSTGNLTNNGGNVQLYAPGQVVRIDGDINVNGIANGQGVYLGNGGKVSVDAAYLFQNGNIFAAGANGGQVYINVNSATSGPQSKIDASAGPDGLGGVIRLKATGVVDIKPGAVMNTSGVSLPGVDANLIQITGGLVNNEGILKANGISTNHGQDANASRGGTIQLTAQDSINLQPVSNALYKSNVFTYDESKALLGRLQGLASCYSNSIRNTGSIMANGGELSELPIEGASGNGGVIRLIAGRNILNQGVIMANGGQGDTGGKGGNIELFSKPGSTPSQNIGLIQAKGGDSFEPTKAGSQGGQITVNYLTNSRNIDADGGLGDIGGAGGTISTRNIVNAGSMHANGGVGSSLLGGQGGAGGRIYGVNIQNSGALQANGADGNGPSASTGGNGGGMTLTNITNSRDIQADGGRAFCGTALCGTGGNGGNITGTQVTNQRTIEATGGSGVGFGGNGGNISLSNLTNDSIITAHAGNGHVGFALEPKTVSGNGGTIILVNTVNRGLIYTNGGFGDDIGGNGGTIKANGITLFGALQADGSSDGTQGGNGGIICIRNFLNQNSLIAANGGFSRDIKGKGGTISAVNGINTGVIEANGGSQFGASSQPVAANGGTIHLTNVINGKNAQILANGGIGVFENSKGGDGGTITGTDVKNYGDMQVFGGDGGTAGGGNGGTMTFTRMNNTGLLEANGGKGRITPPFGPGGNGGTVTGIESTNTGLIRVLGGTGVPNGATGVISGF